MQNKARSAQGVAVKSQAGLWVGQYLEVGEQAFGLYPGTSSRDFVYIKKFTDPSKREIIFSVPNPSPNLSIAFTDITTRSFTVTLTGTKDDISFSFSTKILRRAK
jgi:hypothetical protein